ncbi:Zinc finger CCCH domain-containing protein 44 [Morella rubra]|uniref:Zinc finger CCCH domain-containing protein 44 n=1 Tax=Morella rubra TaxID=262757 RepID=A0A6A1V255_9ROSI|nr:Zinc finger CCCH domain-containing protein 44 [Morella rubra]
MVKYKRKRRINKEIEAEDWCFVCKDGGELIICEYGDCLKVYHPECVGKDVSFLETGKCWTCNCHSCLICHRTPKFHCFCCPNAICKRCVNAAEFAPAIGKNGFCYECLELVLLAEEKVENDSDGGKIDFTDRETYEGLFKEYWEIIKEKEGLTLDDVRTAKAKMKKSENYSGRSGYIKFVDDEKKDELTISDCDLHDGEEYRPLSKRRWSKVQEFIGWGSKPVIKFLKSLGKDTTQQLSQFDVDLIISEYIRENNLLDPENKKKTGYASVVAENINLIYLRRSLVDELLKHRESFEGKVVGSFVKVKADPRDYMQKNSHQLLQVTGVKETSAAGKTNSEVLLLASNAVTDIQISMLSDTDFTEVTKQFGRFLILNDEAKTYEYIDL